MQTRLTKQANQTWESLLEILTCPEQKISQHQNTQYQNITQDFYEFFLKSKFLKPDVNTNYLKLTGLGFQFLLAPKPKQVWEVLKLKYLMGYNLQQKIFLCKLAFGQINVGYKMEGLEDYKIGVLEHLEGIGLAFLDRHQSVNTSDQGYDQRNSQGQGAFYLTYLIKGLLYNNRPLNEAIELLSQTDSINSNFDENISDFSENKEQFIILETNFKIYAYTDSLLHKAILNYFSEAGVSLPGFQCYTITRAKIQAACEQDITPEQIITYLKDHAHEKQYNSSLPGLGGVGKKHILPPVVTDSIRLWGMERASERVKDIGKAMMYDDFSNDDEYQMIYNVADKHNSVIWADKDSRTLICVDDKKLKKAIKVAYKSMKDQN